MKFLAECTYPTLPAPCAGSNKPGIAFNDEESAQRALSGIQEKFSPSSLVQIEKCQELPAHMELRQAYVGSLGSWLPVAGPGRLNVAVQPAVGGLSILG